MNAAQGTVMAVVAGLVLSSQGCAPNRCERLCEWFDRVSEANGRETWSGCQEVCEDDYAVAGNYCRASLGDLSRCVDDVNFTAGDANTTIEQAGQDECEEEFTDAVDDCGCIIDECVDECAESYGAERRPSQTCAAIVGTLPPP